jgi:serine protease Do
MNGKPTDWSVTARASATVLLLGLNFFHPSVPAQAAATATATPSPNLNLQESPLRPEIKAATSLGPVLKKIAPSVVNISSTMIIRERSVPNPFWEDPLFRRFFGDRFGEQAQPREHKTQSLGSGIIVTSDGYILTANHVIEGADKVKVALASGEKEYDAKIVGADPLTDVAVLKIDAKGLPAAVVADSDKLEVGDAVLAIGNPFAVGQTVTRGIVSATGRGGFGVTGYENFIQTDAAINPGNSGGALVDAEGRLVGINTWIMSRTGGYQGIGFAVPINMARYVMEHLTHDGKVSRGYLGLSLQPEMTPELAKQLSLPDKNGALVTSVEPDSPAAKAGFKEGDFVTELNGKKVADMRQLRLAISETSPGTKVNVRLLREGKEKILTATVGTFPEDPRTGGGRGQSTSDALNGVEVADLDASVRREVGIPSRVGGALVTKVDQDANAAEAGLRPGDVIVEINRQAVRNADEAVAMSERVKGDRVLLRIWRGTSGRGSMIYISVENTKRR